ncbi:hypothetical protein SG26_19445 (plasmid) [Haloarcula sp. CBA1115]|uniref:hypothetical protein n=1 Tax=unclassified Haloarcula TaxID=2624677 RepID=UPI00059557C6|nr:MULTISPECIES: hypothetical protein [unclassified Haloarcula]AJF27941.1 hypothetical protein SG26_19445 [Haloarcula sp. CBA1115]
MGAGTTSVVVQPSTDTVTVGNTTTVDIVVTSTTDGVGSLDLDIASTNGSVATVSNTSVAGNPETVQSAEEANGVRIAATGMDTADSGSISVVSVTLTGEAAGTSDVDLTVAAVGDESGTAYNVTSVRDGTLTVESGDNTAATPTETPTPTPTETETPTSTETPTETPTEEDSSSSSGSNDDGDDGDDGDSGSSSSDSDDTATATDTPTVTEPTPSDTPTTTTTAVTERSTEADTEESIPTQTSSGGPAITPNVTDTPSQTAATDNVEPSGTSPPNLLIGGSMIVAVLGGIIIYRRL